MMRTRKINFILGLGLMLITQSLWALSVPFQGIPLNPNVTITANYDFAGFPMIFCYEANQTSVGIVTWKLGKQFQSAPLGVTLVLPDSIFDGQPANGGGPLFITNNTGAQLNINCVFAF